MPRDIPISNGSLLVCFDKDYQIRDFYFPHVGQENHVVGYPCRFGVWVDGHFCWSTDPSWQKVLRYKKETLVTEVSLTNRRLGIELHCEDFVDYAWNAYIRILKVSNLDERQKKVKIFFHHDFRVYGTEVGDTGYYNPFNKSIMHYKGRRYFLCSVRGGVEEYSIGAKALGAAEGTWRDAEDGQLQNTVITHGSVDSTIAKGFELEGGGSFDFEYWICAGVDLKAVNDIDEQLQAGYARARQKTTEEYWRFWVNKENFDLSPLPDWGAELFKRSLLILATQIDAGGAIIAANDSDVQATFKDHYSYLWPRDGALVAVALDLARYELLTQRFYTLIAKLINPTGYLLHKYTPDGALASSWHPWYRNGKSQLPIQEDETALILWGLWEHFKIHRDVEFVRGLYEPLISKAGDFLLVYRDKQTGLPLPSYDLWEERKGVMTFTCCTVEAGLRAAANFARAFGDAQREQDYLEGAALIKEAMLKYLYDANLGRFLRGLVHPHDQTDDLLPDTTVDASLYGLFRFGTFSVQDPEVRGTMKAYRQKLWVQTEIGGIARYQNDWYQAQCPPTEAVPGNPWVISTLWLMMEEIFAAETEDQLAQSLRYLQWVKSSALSSGVLAEQINPFTGGPLSVSPLTWSHATVIEVVMLYLMRVQELRAKRNLAYKLRPNRSDEFNFMFAKR
ncbi:MAG: glycoside hydrolase family 15 protein [Candidatus Caenarcaniphilales bacterium]|nr:glycoside hydrolase family 15 protein [Candidatus Caenarcaniphilales bacterium]